MHIDLMIPMSNFSVQEVATLNSLKNKDEMNSEFLIYGHTRLMVHMKLSDENGDYPSVINHAFEQPFIAYNYPDGECDIEMGEREPVVRFYDYPNNVFRPFKSSWQYSFSSNTDVFLIQTHFDEKYIDEFRFAGYIEKRI